MEIVVLGLVGFWRRAAVPPTISNVRDFHPGKWVV